MVASQGVEPTTNSFLGARAFKNAVAIYMNQTYTAAPPAAVQERLVRFEGLGDDQSVPLEWLEKGQCDSGRSTYALRLGQPMYPHMKLVVEESPSGGQPLFRADAHDNMLHAPPGSRDEAPLAALRAINKELADRIETAWVAAGLPTFKEYLRAQLAQRKESKKTNS